MTSTDLLDLLRGEAWTARPGNAETILLFWLMTHGILAIFAWLIVMAMRRRGTPLAIIGADGLTMPLHRPEFIPWTAVTEVKQVRISRAIFLRLILKEPETYLTRADRRRSWPHADSIMLNIDVDMPNRSTPLFEAARAAHLRATGTAPA